MNAQTGTRLTSGSYTDNPPLHANLLLSSLQIFTWLYLHPKAWHNFIAQVAPDLQPDFSLLDLRPHHWRSAALRRVFLSAYVVWPLAVAFCCGLWWFAIQAEPPLILRGMVRGFSFCLAASVFSGLAHSVAMGIGYSVVLGLGLSVPYSLGGMVFGTVIAAGLGGSVAALTAPRPVVLSMRKRLAGIAGGAVAISILVAAAYVAMSGQLSGVQDRPEIGQDSSWLLGAIYAAGGGLLLGITFALAVSLRTLRVDAALKAGVAALIVGWISYGGILSLPRNHPLISTSSGIAGALLFVGLFVLAFALAERAGGAWVGAVTGALASGLAWLPLSEFLVSDTVPINISLAAPSTQVVLASIVLLGLTQHWWRPLAAYPFYLAWHAFLYYQDRQNLSLNASSTWLHAALRWAPAFWDEFLGIQLVGLDQHLTLVCEYNPPEGQAAMKYLSTSRQRWAAQAAQIELDARRLAHCQSVEAISQAHHHLAAGGELVGPANVLLHAFSLVSQDAGVAMNHTSAYHQRLGLVGVEERLNGLLRELTRSSEHYAARFYPVAEHWLGVVQKQLDNMARVVAASQEIDNPYIVGVPLTEQQRIFVGRTELAARLENWLSDQRSPPLFLFGQRRMGKTSLLLNLGRLLRRGILPLFVDGQYLAAADDYPGILEGMAREMARSASRQRQLALPPIIRAELARHPFVYFNRWLDKIEKLLDEQGYESALLALDELDALYHAAVKGRFEEEDFLNLLRYLIQHRPRFKVLLTSARAPHEFGPWSSHLINVQVARVGYLSPAETRQLIERPTQDFSLAYTPEASQRVAQLCGGHPFLLQLLCYEIVSLKNSQTLTGRRTANLVDVEASIKQSLRSGQFFFEEIQRQGITDSGRAILRRIAQQGEGACVSRRMLVEALPELIAAAGPPGMAASSASLEDELQHLLQRDLLEQVEPGEEPNPAYRFQVELIRRWFAAAQQFSSVDTRQRSET